MAGVSRAVVALTALAWPAAAAGQSTAPWHAHIEEASARFDIPEAWIRRVMQAESGGRTRWRGRPIRSHAGAMGLMQLMPGTWRAMRSRHGLGADPDDPRDNILAGTAHLRAMHDRFGYPGLFAAYNAGPGRYATYLARGGRLPAETVAYVAKVTRAHASRWTGLAPKAIGLAGAGPAVPSQGRGPAPAATGGLGPLADADRAGVFFALDGRQPD
jgi:soluble lytic murein transglycosylase-like protein